MTPEEKAKFTDLFLIGLSESSFASSLANILELSRLPSELNRSKFKALEYELEKFNLVEFVRGRDNSTLDGQCEYFISSKGMDYVSNNKSTIALFKNQENSNIEEKNWVRAFNRLFKILNGSAYMTGSAFLDIAREVDDSIPSYKVYIEERKSEGKSQSRKDFFFEVIKEMPEYGKMEFYETIIKDLEKKVPDELEDLKSLFEKKESVIKKREIPSKDFSIELYNDVLTTIYKAYRGAEQKPSIYSGKGEEDLRDYGLAFLESRYTGAVAAGEAFNKNGKTDIILKSDDGSNLFVAEFKVWHGSVQFHQALEQLFGYLTWRDTKSTLVLFVRNADFSAVLAKIKEEAANSIYYVKYLKDREESSFSYIFRHKDHPNREIQIEIMAFSFPN
ncbi:hypothetical protein [Flavobacterium sp.]|uniref:hypothetical protein n=1 Tax=Flavobacterium sp. TaxID=239 RepID=UPI0031D95265